MLIPLVPCYRSKKPNDIALQFGDYYHPELQWVIWEDGFSLDIDTSRSRLTTFGSAVYDAFCFHGVDGVENVNSHILDLILTNEAALPYCCVGEAADTLVAIDPAYPAIDISEIVSLCFEVVEEIPKFDFRRVDYNVLNEALSSIDWQFLDSQRDLDYVVDMFNAKIRQVLEVHVPLQ